MKLTQCETIVKIMLENPSKEWWSAKDFQSNKYFIGYEATARISDLIRIYPDLFKVAKDGRFRIISINWEDRLDIKTFCEIFEI